ncbi:MAG: hypothetical protein JWO97_4592 [Acidobacteria bacterium]|nr:hypothetical protein [Acidobacteriota bacterium]
MNRIVAFVAIALLCSPMFADCGNLRWDVKVTSDAAAMRISDDLIDTTTEQLGELQRPKDWRRTGARSKEESSVYGVEATLTTFFSEADGDLHLVLMDGGATIVAEIPANECVPDDARFHDAIHEVRRQFAQHFKGAKSKKTVNERVIVYGVAFFDSPHNVSSAAPNFIELHPVISIRFLRR